MGNTRTRGIGTCKQPMNGAIPRNDHTMSPEASIWKQVDRAPSVFSALQFLFNRKEFFFFFLELQTGTMHMVNKRKKLMSKSLVSKGKGLPRSALSDRTITWALNLSWICIFKCFNSHIKRKEADELNFNNTFYLTQHIQNITMSTGNPYKNVNEILYIIFVVLGLWNLVCFTFTVHLNRTSHISNAQWLHVASSHCTGQNWDKVTHVSSEKQLDSAEISGPK